MVHLHRLLSSLPKFHHNSGSKILYIRFNDSHLRLVDEGFSVDACEDVAVLHDGVEAVCRKHLASFQQIAEIGFPSKEVHAALIAASFDHQRALDQLIR